MTDTTQFTDAIIAGMNNEACSFWVGAAVGNWLALRWFAVILVGLLLYKAIDKLALEPLIVWAKDKLKRRKS